MEYRRAKAEKSGRTIRALTEWYQIAGLNAWCTHRLIKGLILPQLTYSIEVWNSVTRIQENQVVINKIIRKAFGLEKKTRVMSYIAKQAYPRWICTKNTATTCWP